MKGSGGGLVEGIILIHVWRNTREITITSRFSVFWPGFEPVTSRIQTKKRYSLIHLALPLWFPQNLNILILITLILQLCHELASKCVHTLVELFRFVIEYVGDFLLWL